MISKLSPRAEKKVFSKYRTLAKEIQDLTLGDEVARKELEHLCYDRIENKQSLAKLAADYSNKVGGLNNTLSATVKTCLDLGNWDIVLDANLIRKLETFVEDSLIRERIKELREKMGEIETAIAAMFQPLTLYVAKKYSSNAYGFDKDDLIQEANKGLLKAIEKYNPDFLTAQGKRVKFFTYAYISASDKVKEYIMNQSRMVRIPKAKLERIFILIESNKITNSIDSTRLALESNKILKYRLNRKLKKHEIFTDQEIEELTYIMRGNSISFDLPVGKRKENLVDLLPDKGDKEIERIDQLDYRVEIKKELRKILTDPEYKVILHKFFFHGDEVSLKETQKSLKEYENIDYSRERINQLKNTALVKLSGNSNIIEMLG